MAANTAKLIKPRRGGSKDNKGRALATARTASTTKSGDKSADRKIASHGSQHRASQAGDDQLRDLFKKVREMLARSMNYYHGIMPRAECESLLANDGDYLLRFTTRDDNQKGGGGRDQFVISVMHNDSVRHIPISRRGTMWYINDVEQKTISELIEYLEDNKHPLPTGAVLMKKIRRPSYYIMHGNVTKTQKIGEGNFGEVYKGTLRDDGNTETPCAIKLCKGDVTKKEITEFMKEARVTRILNHKNIVRFYGVAAQESPVMLVIELADKGGLQSYCQKHPDVTGEQLVSWGTDGARGMAYLHKMSVLHRDLAARNCLLGKDLELKISDFGKSEVGWREIKCEKLKKMPIKWCAPETLSEGKFTTKSDVWSYGVMLWEIFGRCTAEPFTGITNMQAKDKIVNGDMALLAFPPKTPEVGITVMKACWTRSNIERPEFLDLLKIFAPNEDFEKENAD
ncbi:unnamed protein product, partial [Mesorhabditis spiculigera]